MTGKKALPTEAIKSTILTSVGYGQPPVHSRFKKGQSGNPKGRRPKPYEFTADHLAGSNSEQMSRARNEPVKVHINGKVRTISKAEAIQRAQDKNALGGGTLAQRDGKRDLLADDARIARAKAENAEFWRCYRQQAAERLTEAHSKSDQFWIHPDDIQITLDNDVRLRGATSQEEVPCFNLLHRVQKAYLAFSTYQLVAFPNSSEEEREEWMVLTGACLGLLNRSLSTAQAAESMAYYDYLEGLAFFGSLLNFQQVLVEALQSLELRPFKKSACCKRTDVQKKTAKLRHQLAATLKSIYKSHGARYEDLLLDFSIKPQAQRRYRAKP